MFPVSSSYNSLSVVATYTHVCVAKSFWSCVNDCSFQSSYVSCFTLGDKGNGITLILVPLAATAAAAELYVTDRVGIQFIGRRLSLWPREFDLKRTAIRSRGLLFNGFHPRNPYNHMDYYSFTNPNGMEGWVGLVGWPIADTLPVIALFFCWLTLVLYWSFFEGLLWSSTSNWIGKVCWPNFQSTLREIVSVRMSQQCQLCVR